MLTLAPFHFVEMFAEAEAVLQGHTWPAVVTCRSQAPVRGPGVQFPWTLVLTLKPRAGFLPQRATARRGPWAGSAAFRDGAWALHVAGFFEFRALAWAPGSACTWVATRTVMEAAALRAVVWTSVLPMGQTGGPPTLESHSQLVLTSNHKLRR